MANPDPSPRTRFTPGQSGNPGGRPRRKPLTEWARRICDEPAHQGTDKTNGEMVMRTLFNMAKGGDVQAAKLIWAYLEGPPKQTVEFDYRKAAVEAAEEMDIDADLLIREVAMIARQAMEGDGE